jgi:hypothetical protein
LNDDFIYPVMNIKLSFLDDFPSPILSGGDNTRIKKDYGRNNAHFYRDIWWPDIVKAAYKYDVKYTGVVIKNYNNSVVRPLSEQGSLPKSYFIDYARELLKMNGELGIHGFNHQPLAQSGFIKSDYGYKPWKNAQDMVQAITNVSRYVHEIFPNYKLSSYVPPSNILSPEGRSALIKAMPDLKSICSVYLPSDEANPGDQYIQEYEAAKDGIVELPRMTTGYFDTENFNWVMLNGITSIGVFSHFIHPDDILDRERNKGMGWDEMSYEYASLLKGIKDNFGWLRSMTASEGAEEVEKYSNCKIYIEHKDNLINCYCNDFIKDMYFILRSDKKIVSHNGCDLNLIDEAVYLVCAHKASFSIELEQVKK